MTHQFKQIKSIAVPGGILRYDVHTEMNGSLITGIREVATSPYPKFEVFAQDLKSGESYLLAAVAGDTIWIDYFKPVFEERSAAEVFADSDEPSYDEFVEELGKGTVPCDEACGEYYDVCMELRRLQLQNERAELEAKGE